MYASQRNVQIVVALMKSHGVRHVVISPGSRNMALVRSFDHDPFFTCHSVVDERSAAYFAIGISLATNEPVALSCTSAQATRNYIPGLTEAYYRGTPIVAITADYSLSLIGQGVMQTVRQFELPSDTHKVAVQLPVVKDADDEWHCTRLVNEALLGLSHHGSGPVQINIPIDEHWEGGVNKLPSVKHIARFSHEDPEMPPIKGTRVMVAVGEHAAFTSEEYQALESFVQAFGAVVYTTHLSNYHGLGSVNGSLVVMNVREAGYRAYAPDLLITIGHQLGDYDIDAFIRATSPEHWRVSLDGRVSDTYRTLTNVFEMSDSTFFSRYASMSSASPDFSYQEVWAKANAQRAIPSNLPLSHAFVAATLSPLIPRGSSVHFAILSALRNWSFFHLDPSITGFANVAGYGIDGCLSTFIGHAVASDAKCFLVIGDLSFFYDMNSVGIRSIKSNARIVLVNNNGGGEFRLYSHAADVNFGAGADEYIAAAGHHGSARAWVESMGWNYIGVNSKQCLVDNAELFVGDSDRPVLMEVFTTMKDDSDGVQMIRESNMHSELATRIAGRLSPAMKSRIPKPVKEVARNLLGR